MLVSRDGGRNWIAVGPRGDAMAIAMPPETKTAYAAGHDVLLRSDDGGATWERARADLPGTDIHALTGSPSQPGRFYAYVVGRGLFRSDDTGRTWQPLGDAVAIGALAAVRGEQVDVLFALTTSGTQRSADAGRSWNVVPEATGKALGGAGTTLYVADGAAITVSEDGGKRWQRRAFPGRDVMLVAAAPSEPKTAYIVTGALEVWRSLDAGATWERVG